MDEYAYDIVAIGRATTALRNERDELAAEIERLRAMLAEVLPVAWTGGDGMPAAHQEVMARAKAMLGLRPNV